MKNSESTFLEPEAAEAFLRRMGVAGPDSDFHCLQQQMTQAMAGPQDCRTVPPYRWEDAIIEELIRPGDSVLDLGCGNGELLARLAAQHPLSCQGVEQDSQAVLQCLRLGIPVFQGDLQHVLATCAERSYSFAILERTLQTLPRPVETLREMLRVADSAVVSFPNFAHWSVRLSFSLGGRMPVTGSLPYNWYDTPNIHLCSITDFLDWVGSEGLAVRAAWVLVQQEVLPFAAQEHNITAEEALFVLERPPR
ncbi:MAG: methionine biosynthesis protein MetW [Oligosphaeraceae bacterium]|nr:methionine biosynthesis protein MetW [Oligosphaeraceae bacterium]